MRRQLFSSAGPLFVGAVNDITPALVFSTNMPCEGVPRIIGAREWVGRVKLARNCN